MRQRPDTLTGHVEPVIAWADILALSAEYGLTLKYTDFIPWSAA